MVSGHLNSDRPATLRITSKRTDPPDPELTDCSNFFLKTPKPEPLKTARDYRRITTRSASSSDQKKYSSTCQDDLPLFHAESQVSPHRESSQVLSLVSFWLQIQIQTQTKPQILRENNYGFQKHVRLRSPGRNLPDDSAT